MCGLAGEFVLAGSRPADLATWRPITARMQRRGPNGTGAWTDERSVVLCSTRLAVMDPSARASLPLASGDGRYVLAFNGELYDFPSLRAELAVKGWPFRTRGDSEVVLAALATWGTAALSRFNGMFALAFYDAFESRLLLARDHAGIKPLYVCRHGKGVLFGSELDGLLLHPRMADAAVNPQALEMYLRLGHVPAPLAIMDACSMLEPGSWQCYAPGQPVSSGRYFEFPLEPDRTLRGDAAQDAFEAALTNAVRRQLVSDVPAGVFVSGGIDSPLIAALAAREQGGIDTFSVGMEDPSLDESSEARVYARVLRTRHHASTLAAVNVHGLLQSVIDASTEPMADEGMFPALMVSGVARRRVTVALSGDGSDELFLGYIHRQLPALRRFWSREAAQDYLSCHSDFARPDFEGIFPRTPYWPLTDWWPFAASPGPASSPTGWLRKSEYDGYLPFILLKTDRASMYHSLEVRVPFLDREVIDVATKMDPGEFVDAAGGIGKLPVRRFLRKMAGFTTSGKKGFTVPMDDWIRGPLREVAGDALERLRGLDSIEVNRKAVASLLARHHAGVTQAGMALWRLILLDLWFGKLAHARRAASARLAEKGGSP